MKRLMMVMVILALALGITGCGQVDTGEAALELSWGKVVSKPLGPGLHFRTPIAGSFVYYSIQDIRYNMKMAAYTKDMQSADFEISVIAAVDESRLEELHTKFGKNYAVILIEPVVSKCVKATIGQWEADKLVNGREKAADEIFKRVVELLHEAPLKIKGFVIANIDHSDVFEKAIEEKVVAAQAAIRAKNRTLQVEEEARQKVISAEAEAKSMQIRAEALKANQSLVALEFINKWDGKAPSTLMVGSDFKTMLPISK